jgi:hypothetical protein
VIFFSFFVGGRGDGGIGHTIKLWRNKNKPFQEDDGPFKSNYVSEQISFVSLEKADMNVKIMISEHVTHRRKS